MVTLLCIVLYWLRKMSPSIYYLKQVLIQLCLIFDFLHLCMKLQE